MRAARREDNVIEVFEQYPNGEPVFEFTDRHSLDSIKHNAELVLAARA